MYPLLYVSSGRHSRQDSSGSGDSGVYSTGGSSSLRQSNSNQSSAGAEDCEQGHFDLQQLKMQDMAPRLKTQLLITDEGIVDMCVWRHAKSTFVEKSEDDIVENVQCAFSPAVTVKPRGESIGSVQKKTKV